MVCKIEIQYIMNMNGEVKWGIIGCGTVTEVKSGPAFNLVEGSRLVAVMRRNSARAADYAARHGVPRWYDDESRLIADPEVNAVYVATPPGSHMKYAVQSIRAGKPVYIEKPMALNYKECEVIINEAEKNNVKVFVAYYRRALPAFLRVKELISSGTIGEPLMVNVDFFKNYNDAAGKDTPWRLIPEISGGGHFVDLGSHLLDWLDLVFGEVRVVSSLVMNQSKKFEVEDIVLTNLLLGGTVPCSATWCFNASESSTRDIVEITGEHGSLTFSCFNYTPVILKTSDGIRSFHDEKPVHVQQPLIETIVRDLRGLGSCKSTGLSASRTNRVMDEILFEYYNK